MLKIYIIYLPLIFLLSCNDESQLLSRLQLLDQCRNYHSSFREIIPEAMDKGIKCSDYGPGCVGGFQGQIYGVEIIFVEFETVDLACREAERINQYCGFNWLFDDVMNEPVLEHFVKKLFSAKKGRGEEKSSPQ